MIVKTQKRAAKRLGIHPRTLRRWQGMDRFPDCSKGYDTGAIYRWRRDRKKFTDEELDQMLVELEREYPAFSKELDRELGQFDLNTLNVELPPDFDVSLPEI